MTRRRRFFLLLRRFKRYFNGFPYRSQCLLCGVLWSSKTDEFSMVKKWRCANVRRGVWVCEGEGEGGSRSLRTQVRTGVYGVCGGRVCGVWGLRYGANAMRTG
jgi:hypothetical protein